MEIPSEILTLWEQYSSTAFPKGYGGKEINGMDLSFLDAEIAGFVRMYLSDGKLDYHRMQNLRERVLELNTILLMLESEELAYFSRLRELANLVLQEAGK
ncbi:MAG: hypothetical protein HXY35_02910 [Chloroflexi bacterium]|nr:hypothetical protein [Chloroflexota bacterium]